jgi:hypothetical protein
MEDSIDSIGMFSLNVGRDVINSITLYIIIVSWSPLKVVIFLIVYMLPGSNMAGDRISLLISIGLRFHLGSDCGFEGRM